MKREVAAGLLAAVLAAHAQAPPETPPATPPPAEAAPVPSPQTPAPGSESAGAAAPDAQVPTAAAPEESRAPAPKAPAPRTPPQKPVAPPEGARDAEVTALRKEVARLQSELDAERAAAIPAPEEAGSVAPPAGAAWGWLITVALLALAAGFVLGWRLLDRRIRRKYGGLRIY